MSKVLAFLPMRGGSKSIPNKNIKIFNGQPLCYWYLNALQHTDQIDEIVVATDSNNIEKVVRSFGFSKIRIYQRSTHNAEDTSSTESVILEYLESNPSLNSNDIFILGQVTSPLIKSEYIQKGLIMLNKGNFDSILSVTRQKRFMWTENGNPVNYDINSRPRRQEFQGFLVENGMFYISYVGDIMKSKCRISKRVGLVELPENTYLEIDEPEDWSIIESLHKRTQLQ